MIQNIVFLWQGIELSNPQAHANQLGSGTQSTYFSEIGTFSKIKRTWAIPIMMVVAHSMPVWVIKLDILYYNGINDAVRHRVTDFCPYPLLYMLCVWYFLWLSFWVSVTHFNLTWQILLLWKWIFFQPDSVGWLEKFEATALFSLLLLNELANYWREVLKERVIFSVRQKLETRSVT